MTSSSTASHGTAQRDASVLAWLRLVRVFQKIEQRTSRGLRCSDLTLAHFDVLMHIGAAEGITQQELADSLLVTKGNVCQVLGRMQEAGLIARRQEGRANRLFLTDRGRQVFHEAGPAHEQRVAECFAALSKSEQRELLSLLRRLDHALGASPCVVLSDH
jgi:DNA-binding MarR family transcriptional regulator